jgi:hypothetical protein
MNEPEFRRIVAELLREQRRLRNKIDDCHRSSKDIWDKFSAVSTFLSGVLIAAAGLVVSAWFNDRQTKRDEVFKAQQSQIQKVEATSKILPMLADDKTRKVGVLMISELSGDCVYATRLAAGYLNQGSLPAVTELLQTCPKAEDQLKASGVFAQIAAGNLGEESRLAKIALEPKSFAVVTEVGKEVEIKVTATNGGDVQLAGASLDGIPLPLASASTVRFYSGAAGQTRVLVLSLVCPTPTIVIAHVDANGKPVADFVCSQHSAIGNVFFTVK